jgi:1-acyl-sn-glycerol-3-phosphate acyltransferase
MIIYYPSIRLSALHINKNDFDLNQISAKMWSTIILKFVKVKTEIKHINHIPLEDGFIFLANENNPYDSSILLSIFPINISFVFDKRIKIPFLKSWFKRILTLFIDANYDFVKNVDEVENLMIKSGNLLLYVNQLQELNLLSSFIDYAYHTKKTLIPISISGSSNIMKKGKYHKVLVDICLPLHYEEYQTMTHESCLEEIRERIRLSSI